MENKQRVMKELNKWNTENKWQGLQVTVKSA